MKKLYFLITALVFVLSVNVALAAALRPYGGRIITAPTPAIECPADYADGFESTDPYTITPVGASPPIFAGILSPLPQFGQIVPSAWILGLYMPVPIPDCFTTSAPPVPVSIFKAVLWGTSVPDVI